MLFEAFSGVAHMRHHFRSFLTAGYLMLLASCAAAPSVAVHRVASVELAPSNHVSVVRSVPSQGELLARLHIVGAPGQQRVQLIAALSHKAMALGANVLYIADEKVSDSEASSPLVLNPSGGNYQTSSPLPTWTIDAEAYFTHARP